MIDKIDKKKYKKNQQGVREYLRSLSLSFDTDHASLDEIVMRIQKILSLYYSFLRRTHKITEWDTAEIQISELVKYSKGEEAKLVGFWIKFENEDNSLLIIFVNDEIPQVKIICDRDHIYPEEELYIDTPSKRTLEMDFRIEDIEQMFYDIHKISKSLMVIEECGAPRKHDL